MKHSIKLRTTKSAPATTKLFHGSQLMQSKIAKTLDRSAKLTPSRHALKASSDDRYGNIVLPTNLPERFEIVELEQKGSINSKFVLRFEYDAKRDICIVIRPDRQGYTIVTTWINLATDHHKTLDLSKYNNPTEVQY